jgi:uncharacterized coiled-coil DUF342 family protein
MSNEENKLDELEAQVAKLMKTRSDLYEELSKKRDQRDKLNESANKIREEAHKHRSERDQVNRTVQEIKSQLGPLFEELDSKNERLQGVEQNIQSEYKSRPNKSRVERDLNRVEWEVMTTPTLQMKEREDELVTRASQLRRTLEEFKKLEKKADATLGYMADKKATEIEIKSIRQKIDELAEKSQEHHEKMILLYNKADEERDRAQTIHEKYVELLQSIDAVKAELDVVMPQVRALRNGLRIEDIKISQRRRMSSETYKDEMKKEAIKKMESGQKLTMDDLRFIYGDGEDDEEEET